MHVETPAGRMYYETEGEGEPVVLAGGGPGVAHDHYHPWFSALARHHRVVYLDYLGTGRSDRAERYSIELYADGIEALRAALGAERIALIGISFGGMPALAYALRHPGRARALVLSNAQVSAATWQEGNIDGVNAALAAHFPERWEEVLALRAAGVRSLDPRYQALYAELLEDLEWADPHHPELRPSEGSAGVYAAVVGDDPEWSVTGTMAGFDPPLAALDLPALVVTGRWDRLTPPRIAAATARALPRAELAVLEGSAHRPWAEEPDAYFERVGRFLAA